MEVKADSTKRTFTGYASKFGNVDLHNDIIEKGAFSKTIQERMPKKMIKVLWQHMEPIGIPTKLEETDEGLYVEGKLSKTRLADEAIELMKDNVVDGMSIGYDIIKDDEDEKGIRHLKELKLYEVSIVTWGANPEAMITNVKHLNALNSIFKDENIRSLEEIKNLLDRLNDTLDGGFLGTKDGKIIVNMDELKAGRVLSRKNRDNLKQAVDLITTVLDTADEETPKSKGLKDEDEDQETFMTQCMSENDDIEDEEERRNYCLAQWNEELEKDEDEKNFQSEEFKSLLDDIRSYTKR